LQWPEAPVDAKILKHDEPQPHVEPSPRSKCGQRVWTVLLQLLLAASQLATVGIWIQATPTQARKSREHIWKNS
jgi:hypothetical protein